MTIRDLLTFFEGFYGEKYSGVFLDTMTAYLDGYTAEFYRATAKVLVKRFSRSYGKAPGPAEIEKNMVEILDTMPKQKALPEPENKVTPEEAAEYLAAIKEIIRPKKGKELKIIVQEGGNYCMRTAQELEELRKNSDYHGVVINMRGKA